jgi:uncharacterized membrane protein
MLSVDWYKVTEVSEEPAASFVRVQKFRERILNLEKTMNMFIISNYVW